MKKEMLDFTREIEEILDEALDTLNVEEFERLLDNIENSIESHR